MRSDFPNKQPKSSFVNSGLDALKGKLRPKKAEKTERVAVCDLGRSRIILLEVLKKSTGELHIEKFEHIRNTLQDQRPALLLKPFFENKKFPKEGIRVTLKGHGVVIRFVRFPKMKLEDLASAMKFEVEQYVPYELEDCVLDYAVVDDNVQSPEGPKMDVMLAVVKRQELEPTIDIFRNLDCKLSVIDVDILSAMSALEFFFPEDCAGHVGLLDVGGEISTLGVIREGKPRFIRDISYGLYDIQKRMRSHSNLSHEAFEQLLDNNETPSPEIATVLAESLEGLVGELRISFDYYRDQSNFEKPIQKLFISGGGSFHPVILKALSDGLGVPVGSLEVLSKLKWAASVNAEELQKYEAFLAVPLGLAVRSE